MKKILAAVLSFAMAFSLVACGGTEKKEADTPRKTDVAFITDTGNIDDQSFNQYTWAGVQEFGKKHELSTNYYKPSEDSDAARIEQMDNAIRDGAKAVVMAGYLFANSLAVVQKKYPEVTFVAADMGLGDLAEPAKNTALISYRDELNAAAAKAAEEEAAKEEAEKAAKEKAQKQTKDTEETKAAEDDDD